MPHREGSRSRDAITFYTVKKFAWTTKFSKSSNAAYISLFHIPIKCRLVWKTCYLWNLGGFTGYAEKSQFKQRTFLTSIKFSLIFGSTLVIDISRYFAKIFLSSLEFDICHLFISQTHNLMNFNQRFCALNEYYSNIDADLYRLYLWHWCSSRICSPILRFSDVSIRKWKKRICVEFCLSTNCVLSKSAGVSKAPWSHSNKSESSFIAIW